MSTIIDFPADPGTLTPQEVTSILGGNNPGDDQLVRPGQGTNRTTNVSTRPSTVESNATNATVKPSEEGSKNKSNATTSTGAPTGQTNQTSTQTGNAAQSNLFNASNLTSNVSN